MSYNRTEFDSFLMNHKVIGFKEQDIKLKSGRLCRYYANCRALTDTTESTRILAQFISDFCRSFNISYDYFYGVPAGATKAAVAVNLILPGNRPLVIGREKPKEHGEPRDRYFIGPVEKGQKIVVLEDVTTTGGSLVDAIQKLKEADIIIAAAVGMVNRLELTDGNKTVEQRLAEFNIPYYSMTDVSTLIPRAAAENPPSSETKNHIIKYFEQYSSAKISF